MRPGGFLWRREWVWIGWLALSAAGLSAGLRFFPRYYFQILPVIVLMAARGFTLLGRSRELVALLLLIPATRFGPSYLAALRNPAWRDIGMDRDSRSAAAAIVDAGRNRATPSSSGDTVPSCSSTRGCPWAPYTWIRNRSPVCRRTAISRAREPVETDAPARRRAALARSHPTFVVDGLGLYNPRLAITSYPDLGQWLAQYREVARQGQTIIYRRE